MTKHYIHDKVTLPNDECLVSSYLMGVSPPADEYQVAGTHYTDMAVEPWEVIDYWPVDMKVGFHRGNALKYIMRAGAKGPALEDYKKAKHYLEKLIEVLTDADRSEKESGCTEAS